VETNSGRPYACDVVLATNPLFWIFVKFVVSFLLQKDVEEAWLSWQCAQWQQCLIYWRKWVYSRDFHGFRPVWVTFVAGDLQLTPFNNCKFHENQRRADRILLKDAYEIWTPFSSPPPPPPLDTIRYRSCLQNFTDWVTDWLIGGKSDAVTVILKGAEIIFYPYFPNVIARFG
jgi:hypothetical protein